jgi:glycosyltransferase involved in cell wall biosynthesis
MRLYFLVTLKRKLEEVLMAPFVWRGKRWARKNPLGKEFDVFFFFPIYGLGGAEKINADIVRCFGDKKAMIFFTRRSKEQTMLHLFEQPHVTWKDISRWTDNKRRYWDNFFWRGVCAEYVNRQKQAPVVFNGQCNFAYKLFPHLRAGIRTVELLHNSDKHFAWITFPYIPFISHRILVADRHVEDHSGYYDEIGIPSEYKSRIRKVLYQIEPVAGSGPRASYQDRLQVYYAGRGGAQKRVPLLVAAMRQCIARGLPIDFHLAGNFADELPADINSLCSYHGQIQGGAPMHAFHQRMDVLMMTSAYEGFPMVIMEAMIDGVIPVATAVDGVPEHIQHQQNGLLIQNAADEAGVVSQLVAQLAWLCTNREKLPAMSQAAYTYARNTFSAEKFCRNYREVMGYTGMC